MFTNTLNVTVNGVSLGFLCFLPLRSIVMDGMPLLIVHPRYSMFASASSIASSTHQNGGGATLPSLPPIGVLMMNLALSPRSAAPVSHTMWNGRDG